MKTRIVLVHMLFSMMLCGCATNSTILINKTDKRLQWPPPPLTARIEWVQEINGYRDSGLRTGFWSRVDTALFGEEEVKEGFRTPYGIYVDARKRLFVVDSGLAVVHVLDMQENQYSVIGNGTGAPFYFPISVIGDGGDTIFITDPGKSTVFRYNLKDATLMPFITIDAGRPTGIAFNVLNRLLYVADTSAHQVIAFDLNGKERFRIGSHGVEPGKFNYPTDLFIDRRGLLYVTDALNSRIQIFSPEGALQNQFGSPGDSEGTFGRPKGVAVDQDGHIYVADGMLDTVKIFSETGDILLEFGASGVGPGQFKMPSGIFIDDSNHIYVADSLNRRIQVFRYLGTHSALDQNRH